MDSLNALWWLAVVVLMGVGVVGTVLPALPGPVLVLAGALLGAWIDDFSRVGALPLGVITLAAALAWAADWVAAALGAGKVGASRWAMAGAALGTVAGVFTGLIGLLFMPLVGAVAGELLARRAQPVADAGRQAARAGLATWLGMLIGTAVKLALVGAMVGVFVAALWF